MSVIVLAKHSVTKPDSQFFILHLFFWFNLEEKKNALKKDDFAKYFDTLEEISKLKETTIDGKYFSNSRDGKYFCRHFGAKTKTFR